MLFNIGLVNIESIDFMPASKHYPRPKKSPLLPPLIIKQLISNQIQQNLNKGITT